MIGNGQRCGQYNRQAVFRRLALGLFLAATGVVRAGDGASVSVTNSSPARQAITNVLALWLDVPTNVVLDRAISPVSGTNWTGADLVRTGATWQATALLETGFFCERRTDVPTGRRITLEGCYQSLDVGWKKYLGDGISVGVGVGFGTAKAFIRSPP